MAKCSDLKCRHCGKSADEIGGYLSRVNKGELPSIWECAPNCAADLPQDTRLLLALEIEPKQSQEGG